MTTDATIPTTQKAAWIEDAGPNGRVVIRDDVAVSQPKEGEILVKMECSGLCHSDVRNVIGWGTYTSIPGHEGIGRVVAVGPSVSTSLLNTRVGIKWLYSACSSCSVCRSGYHNNCSKQTNSGRQVTGTLQEYMIADAKFASRIPEELASEIAAPLLCAGLSMAGAVDKFDGELKKGDWVVVPGAGGGLGHIGVQIAARVKGYKVIAIDTGDEKRALCGTLGAEEFIDFAKEDVESKVKELTDGEGAHGIVIVPGSEKAYELAPKLIRNRGVLVCVGLPKDGYHIPIQPIECANRGLVIKGSSTGNEVQMQELFAAAVKKLVVPRVEVQEFAETNSIIEKLKRNEVSGRIVVKIP